MKKKIGRTFAEATAEYEAEHGSLEGYHRDIDEVLADPSLSEALDRVIKESPGGERKFWEDALKMNLELFGESEWTRRIRESLETGKFPPEPIY